MDHFLISLNTSLCATSEELDRSITLLYDAVFSLARASPQGVGSLSRTRPVGIFAPCFTTARAALGPIHTHTHTHTSVTKLSRPQICALHNEPLGYQCHAYELTERLLQPLKSYNDSRGPKRVAMPMARCAPYCPRQRGEGKSCMFQKFGQIKLSTWPEKTCG